MIPILIAAGMLIGSAAHVAWDRTANWTAVKISAVLFVLMVAVEFLT